MLRQEGLSLEGLTPANSTVQCFWLRDWNILSSMDKGIKLGEDISVLGDKSLKFFLIFLWFTRNRVQINEESTQCMSGVFYFEQLSENWTAMIEL